MPFINILEISSSIQNEYDAYEEHDWNVCILNNTAEKRE